LQSDNGAAPETPGGRRRVSRETTTAVVAKFTGVLESIVEIFAGCRFAYGDEEGLQAGLAAALEDADYSVRREVRLDGQSRIDLLVGRIGIEVKVAGKPDAVLRQVTRYAHSDLIDGIVLVTTRVRHRMPDVINGKPIVVVSLAAAGL